MDMGFPRERCVEALNYTSTVESATEYLLTHMTAGNAARGGNDSAGMDMSEDEQIRAAIQLSLTTALDQVRLKLKVTTHISVLICNVLYIYVCYHYFQPESSSETKAPDDPLSGSGSASMSVNKSEASTSKLHRAELSANDITLLKHNLFPACMAMLDTMPNTIFKVCQLLVVVANRDKEEWRQSMFKQLLTQVCQLLVKASLRILSYILTCMVYLDLIYCLPDNCNLQSKLVTQEENST